MHVAKMVTTVTKTSTARSGKKFFTQMFARASTSMLCVMLASAVVSSGCANRPVRPLTPCTTSGVVQSIKINKVNNVDLLFVVDSSPSMKEEIPLLADQLPKIVEVLATGDLDCATTCDGVQDFPPVKSLHLGVVTVDMGVAGADQQNYGLDDYCKSAQYFVNNTKSINLGDDGVLWNKPNKKYTECAMLPATTTERYITIDDTDTAMSRSQKAVQFGCLQKLLHADAGGNLDDGDLTDRQSCGFEQQLDSMMKALAPTGVMDKVEYFSNIRVDGSGNSVPLDLMNGPNAGFLRSDDGTSLLGVIMVTDEDDCSAKVANPPAQGGPFGQDAVVMAAKSMQVLCPRLATKEENGEATALYPVQKYIDGLLSLRPNPDYIVFSAIAGIPIDEDTKSAYTNRTDTDFDKILAAPAMQNAEELKCLRPNCNDSTPDLKDLYAKPACSLGTSASASPARRIVRVAKELAKLGAPAIVRPICDDNFSDAIQAIISRIADALGAVCLPRALKKSSDSLVGCDVLETLPLPGVVPNAATTCAELAGKGREETPVGKDAQGREICRVKQLASAMGTAGVTCNPTTGDGCGWYYDDFSDEVKNKSCKPTKDRMTSQRIAFTEGSQPFSGSRIRLECLERTQSVQAYNAATASQGGAGFGADCGSGCKEGLFCESNTTTCQKKCSTKADCPTGYECDTKRTDPICVNPTCSSL